MAAILAISHDGHMYGAQRSLLDAVIGLAAAGHRVEVCVPRDEGALVEALAANGIPVRVVRFRRWIPDPGSARAVDWLRLLLHLPASLWRAIRLLRAGGYDVVYTNTATVLDFALAAKACRIPHVWHLRESAAGHPQLRSPLSNRGVIAVVRALSARVIYNSRHLLAVYGGVEGGKEAVVHNGVRAPHPRARGVAAVPARTVAIVAGFMDHGKGLDVLLDAVALLPPHLKARFLLRVAGDIESRYLDREIKPRLAKLGDTVELLGWVERMEDAMADADLLVSTAREETFGRTLVEAMMLGLPVLATRSGGPQEIVVHETTGLLVEPDNPARFCAELTRLLLQPELLRAYGRAGRERARSRFSLSSYVGGIERCLSAAISEHNPAPGSRP